MKETTATRPNPLDLPRKDLRYQMFRLANEAQGGSEADGAQLEEIREHFERQPVFQLAGGWEQFGVRWDIDSYVERGEKKSNGEILPLDKSHLQEWDDYCALVARELPEPEPEIEPEEKEETTDLVVDVLVHGDGTVDITEREVEK